MHHLFPSIQILRMAVSLTNRILVHMGKLSSIHAVKTLFVQYSAHCVTKPTPSSKPFRQYEFTGCLRLRAILPSSISCVESKHRPNHHRLWRPSWILFGMTKKEALPVNEVGSPWAIPAPARFVAIKYSSRQCSWPRGSQLTLMAYSSSPIINVNDKYVQIKSRPEAGKKDIVD